MRRKRVILIARTMKGKCRDCGASSFDSCGLSVAGGGCRAMVAYARCGRFRRAATALQRLLLQDNVAQRFDEFFVFFARAHGYAEVVALLQAANVIELADEKTVHAQLVFKLFHAACA